MANGLWGTGILIDLKLEKHNRQAHVHLKHDIIFG